MLNYPHTKEKREKLQWSNMKLPRTKHLPTTVVIIQYAWNNHNHRIKGINYLQPKLTVDRIEDACTYIAKIVILILKASFNQLTGQWIDQLMPFLITSILPKPAHPQSLLNIIVSFNLFFQIS